MTRSSPSPMRAHTVQRLMPDMIRRPMMRAMVIVLVRMLPMQLFNCPAEATLQLRPLEALGTAATELGPLHICLGLIPDIAALAMSSAHAGLGLRLPMHIGLSLVNMLLTFRHDLILPA